MNDAVCVCCGHGTPADGWLCRTCLDSGETWDDSPPTPFERAWIARVTGDAHPVFAEREDARRWVP